VPPEDPILLAASRLFGYRSLRPGQREAIQSVLDGRDTLAVMPTAGGKSAIYELSGPLLSGPTVVVSPLIALQRDQLATLEAGGKLIAVALNSVGTARERQHAVERLAVDGRPPDFVFLAPEQLANGDVLRRLAELRPVLLAVDEAHLVSRWGPDFRPDYLRIGPALEHLGRPPVLAVTATAAPPVRDEIVQRLGMRDPAVLVRGFSRDNIGLAVHGYFTSESHKLEVLQDNVIEAVRGGGHGIVYGATHHRVETVAANLSARGLRAAAYHAGLPNTERSQVEQRFRRDELDVVVATIAFGMGIDKPNVRWVYHADISGSLDEYYQELGRAGRDGAPADAVLYFRAEDLALPRRYAASTGPSRAALDAVAAALASAKSPLTLNDLRYRSGLSRQRTEAAAMALADAGGVSVDVEGVVSTTGDITDAVTDADEQVRARRAVERARTETMEAYAHEVGCRWRFLLEYFGEPADERCGHCDNDQRAAAATHEAGGLRPFARGARVRHPVFGEGEVIGYAGHLILVAFDEAGYKRLDLGLVTDGDALEKVSSPLPHGRADGP
jgi:ATP-dependent DNA helicase RecQ